MKVWRSPLRVCTAGRGRSVGSSSRGGSPASCCFQYASCCCKGAVASPRSCARPSRWARRARSCRVLPDQWRCHAAKSAYWMGNGGAGLDRLPRPPPLRKSPRERSGGQLTNEDTDRPTVGDDVVHRHQCDASLGLSAMPRSAAGRAAMDRLPGRTAGGPPRPAAGVAPPARADGQRRAGRSPAGRTKLSSAHNIGLAIPSTAAKEVRSTSCRRTISFSARSERRHVQQAAQAHGCGHVVEWAPPGAPAFELIEEPESLLGERERTDGRALGLIAAGMALVASRPRPVLRLRRPRPQ